MNEITFAQEYEVMCKELLALERESKKLEKQKKEAKATICEAMEKYGIKMYENDILKLTYVAETSTESIDSKAFQMDDPDLYDEILGKYNKETKRSAYVKVTPK